MAMVALLAALALVYTNAAGVTRVAEQARTQQLAESALGATAAARNALGQALILASSVSVEDEVMTAWVEEARLVLAHLDARVQEAAALQADPDLVTTLAITLALSGQTLDAIAAADPETAGAIATEQAAPSYEALTALLVEVRDDAARAIAAASLEAGSVATASRFMVALFMPSLAVVVAILMNRRRRRAERLVADLERERSLNRSKDQLLANLSHELRTPLTGIYTSALTIEEIGPDDPKVWRELNGMIIDQSADLTRMVEDLLASAQADAGRLNFLPVPTPIRDEVDAVVREFARLPTRIEVRVTTAAVYADPGRLRQLLRNLLSNAVRHGMPPITVRGTEKDDGYLLEVSDDGVGVPEEIAGHLFERFVHQGDRPLTVGSVGLGLAICRVLAEGMGGAVSYERRGDQTIFAVRLSLAVPAEEAAAA